MKARPHKSLLGLSQDNRLVALAMFLWASGEGMFLYIQPLYIAQLGAGPVQIGGVLALDGAARALSFFPGGLLSDRIGPKRVMQLGWGIGLIAVLLMSAARDWRGIIPGVVLYAVSALCIPAVSSYVVRARGALPPERELTLVYAGYSAGNIISPAVGGWLANWLGMRAVYLAAVGFLLVSTLVLMRLADHRAERVEKQQTAARPLPAQAVFMWRSLRPLAAYGGLTFLVFLAMYIGQPLAPNFLHDAAGWSVASIGAMGSAQALGMTLLNPLLGRLGAGRRRRGIIASQGLVWLAFGSLLLGARQLPGLVVASYFLRSGYYACRALAGVQAAGAVAPANRGMAFGLVETVIASSQMAAPYLAGWLYAWRPDLPILVGLGSVPVTMACVAAFGLGARSAERRAATA